jgi:serine/threonine protein kinase
MKCSNILISNDGTAKLADFGLARDVKPNNPKYTNLVVTRWYRPPELLMGESRYDDAVDIWGVGCIFGELLRRRPLIAASTDLEQLDRINRLCGTPTEETWPGYKKLPCFDQTITDFDQVFPRSLREKFPLDHFDKTTVDFLDFLLTMNPKKRPTASSALKHDYFFTEPPAARPKTSDFKPFPTSHELAARKAREEYQAVAQHLPGSSRPVLPPHYDALPPVESYGGSYIPTRLPINKKSVDDDLYLTKDYRTEKHRRDDRYGDDKRSSYRDDYKDTYNDRSRHDYRDRSRDDYTDRSRHDYNDRSRDDNRSRSRYTDRSSNESMDYMDQSRDHSRERKEFRSKQSSQKSDNLRYD